MKKKYAQELVNALGNYKFERDARFDLKDQSKGTLSNFHHWADDKPCLGAFLVQDNQANTALWFLVIEWNSNNGYYLVLFPENRSGPLLEIHQEHSQDSLRWIYSPSRQDGRNSQRKEMFIEAYGGLEAQIETPGSQNEVPEFLSSVFYLSHCHSESHFGVRETDYVIITENDESQWLDDTGVVYHFPKRYLKYLQPGVRAIYYKGKLRKKKYSSSRLSDDPHYFGIATIGKAFSDTDSPKSDYFVTINDYRPFPHAVANKIGDTYLEAIPVSRETNYWRDGVRPIDEETYKRILSRLPAAALKNTEAHSVSPEEATIPATNDVENALDSLAEGRQTQRFTTIYERNPALRKQALYIHGYSCSACGFDFKDFYGAYAEGFIHVHHVVPISEYEGERRVDPEHDLIPVCANCHSVIHRRKDQTLSISDLKQMISDAQKS